MKTRNHQVCYYPKLELSRAHTLHAAFRAVTVQYQDAVSHIPQMTLIYLSVLYSCTWAESTWNRSEWMRSVNHRHAERKIHDLKSL